ncbi:MAG: translation initiation factor IF-2 subunit gamma [Candidatus Aenigmatarchaeota archaeon]
MTEPDPRLLPEVNIGTLGHVDHGKSTLVEALTGKWPASHSEELKRGITIRLGYADATIYKCEKGGELTISKKCLAHASETTPVRTVSFVDAPGHETLMATALAGAALMNGALLVIAANEKCPQPQTREHLMVLNIAGLNNMVIVQTKIDLVNEEQAMKNYQEIKAFVKGTVAENVPVIPVSSQAKVNIEALLNAIQENIPTPQHDPAKPPRMLVVRSFDVNKPGTQVEKLRGGVLGGSLMQGRLKVGDEIEIRPGVSIRGKWVALKTKVSGIQKTGINMEEAGPGGLLGVMTGLDPSLSKADSLSGSVAGTPEALPPTIFKVKIELQLFPSMDGEKIDPVKQGDQLLLNIGVARTAGTVEIVKKGLAELELRLPVVAQVGDRIAISKRIGDRWRLIGWGTLK